MPCLLISSPDIPTLGDLLDHLGGVPAERVRYYPLPGTATEQDVIDLEAKEDRLCELVDGVMIEKAYDFQASVCSAALIAPLFSFVNEHDFGIVVGGSVMIRVGPGSVRIPGAAFVSWGRLPERRIPSDPVSSIVPNLIVEMFNRGNTSAELDRKRREYFDAGVQLLWIVNHRERTVAVHSPSGEPIMLDETQMLDGGLVLPGFSLIVASVFAQIPR